MQFLKRKDNQKGFTLIELLVVIAIIGILATTILVSLNEARVKARDVRRLADVRQFSLALEIYYDNNNAYVPVSGCVIINEANLGDLTPDVLSVLPVDPIIDNYYYYGADSNSDAQDYVIRVVMENDAPNSSYPYDIYGCACEGIKDYCLVP